MPAYFATQALLAEGWAHNVRLDVDAAGMLTAITPDSTAQDAEFTLSCIPAGDGRAGGGGRKPAGQFLDLA